MLVAEEVLRCLTTEDRKVLNVTQWAKQEACWHAVGKIPATRLDLLEGLLISKHEAKETKSESRKLQVVDATIRNQTLVVKQNKRNWEKILNDQEILQRLSPTDLDLIGLVSRPGWVPSELQAARLVKVLEIAWANGTLKQLKEDEW
jgi:hypothetical protein